LYQERKFMQQSGSATACTQPRRIERFEYPASPGAPSLPDWIGWDDAEAAESASDTAGGTVEAEERLEIERRLAEERRKSFEAGREQGRIEGRQAEHEGQAAAQSAAEERRVRQAAELVEGLARERDRYLQAVEHEVVELALAVAARILRREAQMDPLLLTGAVRVALGQLSASTQVRLRVPPSELDLWTEAIALLPNLAVKPTVVAGEGMRLGDCVIETELGSVDLGIRSQLGEIERGFFDRAGRRGAEPARAANEAAGALQETRS
jgi:flagellar assembly protein FliH